MRRLTLVQEIATSVDEHWKLFLDDEYDRVQCVEGFGFSSFEVLERRETDDEIFRRIRAVPKLEVPGAVAKLLGPRFAYTEEGRFDKKTRVWRSRLIPSVLSDRLTSDAVVRAEPAGPEGARCRRTCELSVEARIFGVGGLVESALEKTMRDGWEKGAAYMNEYLRKKRG